MAAPVHADDGARANRLLIEAVGYIRDAEMEPTPEGKFVLLRKAHDKLVEIVNRYPSTDLAVKLATGPRIGAISLPAVRRAMNRASRERVPRPTSDSAPVGFWRHGASVIAIAMDHSGRRVLTVGGNGVGAVLDLESGKLVRMWRHGADDGRAAAFSPRGERALTVGRRGLASLRAVATGRVLGNSWEHDRTVSGVALSRDRRKALVGAGSVALLIDVGTLDILRRWRRKAPVTSVAWSPGGRWILAGFADGRAVLGEAETGKTRHIWKHSGSGAGGVMSAAFSANGQRVLTGGANWRAVLRDTRTGRTVRQWLVRARVTSAALSRDGRWVLTGDDGWEVELHDARTGRTVRKWRYEAEPRAVAFSPDGRRALMGFADGVVIVCDILVDAGAGHRYKRTSLTREGGCW
ncbi:MAG: WD40 repeat domain-containing protein [Defluviicoccus sp.]|nr:WD40 repeat domain-containing protein [Defluviicoccus sp.]